MLKINLQQLKDQENANQVIRYIAEAIGEKMGKAFTGIDTGQTREKLEFRIDDTIINALYMNGIADNEKEETTDYTDFFVFSWCTFV